MEETQSKTIDFVVDFLLLEVKKEEEANEWRRETKRFRFRVEVGLELLMCEGKEKQAPVLERTALDVDGCVPRMKRGKREHS